MQSILKKTPVRFSDFFPIWICMHMDKRTGSRSTSFVPVGKQDPKIYFERLNRTSLNFAFDAKFHWGEIFALKNATILYPSRAKNGTTLNY